LALLAKSPRASTDATAKLVNLLPLLRYFLGYCGVLLGYYYPRNSIAARHGLLPGLGKKVAEIRESL
jgi:hypothetical protein